MGLTQGITLLSKTFNVIVDDKIVEEISVHPLEQPRNILNPHGFIDMRETYELYGLLLSRSGNKDFNLQLENDRNYLSVNSKRNLEASKSINIVEIVYGTIRQADDHKLESVLGSLICMYYNVSQSITVLSARNGKGESIPPSTILRSINLNGFLGLPEIEFEILENEGIV